MKRIKITFIGNPNCGKTTLFNAYTGANLKTANRPGVTVEKSEGKIKFRGEKIDLVDLPGIYSLSSYTMEERVAAEYILSGEADAVINVVDASCLERNLYLSLRLAEMCAPIVIALNMMDIVKARGTEINCGLLGRLLGIPVVPVSAKTRGGLAELMEAAVHCARKKEKKPRDSAIGEDSERKARERYDFIGFVLDKAVTEKGKKPGITDKIDRFATHPIMGIPIFAAVMATVFFLTFYVGNWIKEFFESWLESFSRGAESILISFDVNEAAISLAIDGITAGVGGVLTFLPNIFILFLLLALLEDSGYMSRASYITDGIMSGLGLSGRAFVPLLLGLGCSVPAVMSSRIMEDRRARRRVIAVIPFISCSARLPVYVMLSEMFFGKYKIAAAYSMYVIGFAAAAAALYAMSRGEKDDEDLGLLIELPEYRLPSLRTVAVFVTEKIKDFLAKAGTVVFLASVVLWFILNYGADGRTTDAGNSFGAAAGKALVPILKPAGLGFWQIAVALIAGIAAKEVIISAFSVLYGIGNISSAEGMSILGGLLRADGFSAVNAYAMMIFCLLYIPCAATIAAIHRETGSLKMTAEAAAVQLACAWLTAVLFYQIGRVIF